MIPKEFRPAEKYIGLCARCGQEGLKKRMISVYLKDSSYGPVRIACHVCQRCAPEVLDFLGIGMPEGL